MQKVKQCPALLDIPGTWLFPWRGETALWTHRAAHPEETAPYCQSMNLPMRLMEGD